MLHKDSKESFGHVRQQQRNQIAYGWGQSNVQVTELVVQLYWTHQAVSLGCPAALALGAGARPQLITVVGALTIELL